MIDDLCQAGIQIICVVKMISAKDPSSLAAAPVLSQLLTGECVVGQPPLRRKSDFLHVVLSQAHHLQIVFLLLGDLEQVGKQIAELEDSVESEWHSQLHYYLIASALQNTHSFNIDPNMPHEVG